MSELDWMWDEEPYEVSCDRCGKHGLVWDDASGRWVLIEPSGEDHVCNPADVLLHAASDFKDCDE